MPSKAVKNEYIFFSKDQIILGEAHCFHFFSGFQAHFVLYFVLATTVNQQKEDNDWRMGDPYFWYKSTKFPRVARNKSFFPYLWNPFLVSIFSAINPF